MIHVNCTVGDLAIVVRSHNPENLGSVVLIKSSKGLISWGKGDPEQTWLCEISSNGWLVYDNKGYTTSSKIGLIPDRCLKPITPPKNHLFDDQCENEQLNLNLSEVL